MSIVERITSGAFIDGRANFADSTEAALGIQTAAKVPGSVQQIDLAGVEPVQTPDYL